MKQNRYKSLAKEEWPQVEKNALTEYVKIYRAPTEDIMMMIVDTIDGRKCYGYRIEFKSGTVANRAPGEIRASFGCQRNAVLHFLGHILANKEHFSDDCIYEVKLLVLKYLQENLDF